MPNDQVSLNTSEADNLLCSWCNQKIPFMETRDNRVDCEDELLETYHLACYDMKLFGHITKTTQKKMNRLGI